MDQHSKLFKSSSWETYNSISLRVLLPRWFIGKSIKKTFFLFCSRICRNKFERLKNGSSTNLSNNEQSYLDQLIWVYLLAVVLEVLEHQITCKRFLNCIASPVYSEHIRRRTNIRCNTHLCVLSCVANRVACFGFRCLPYA